MKARRFTRLTYAAVLFFLLIQFAHLAGVVSTEQSPPTMREVCQQYVCSDTGK